MRVILLIIVLFFPCFQATSENVTVHPNPSQELSLKKSWALSQEPVIALLFRMRSQGGQRVVSAIQVGNVVLPFELHKLPVIWLWENCKFDGLRYALSFV